HPSTLATAAAENQGGSGEKWERSGFRHRQRLHVVDSKRTGEGSSRCRRQAVVLTEHQPAGGGDGLEVSVAGRKNVGQVRLTYREGEMMPRSVGRDSAEVRRSPPAAGRAEQDQTNLKRGLGGQIHQIDVDVG